MKRKNRNRQKGKTSQKDINQEFGEYCEDYALQGNNLDEVRNYLQFASIAWNLSLYPQETIDEQIVVISDEYERLNPELINSQHLQHDLKILVGKKNASYPEIKRTITKVEVEEDKEQYKISIKSEEFQQNK
ncbi:hypothetical protein [Desulfogranum japonicum]|uniref:hypothetical protein n=1 Tax=Desulfogranum japonicum TaxID=231447 RepID=UPI0004223687|nr:hypothetical protein [Desulfogranum japonicum]